MPDYLVKWKGQISGPYSVEDLQRMFEDREIGPMHEISVEGTWITARTFFRRNASKTSASSSAGTGTQPSTAAVAAESRLPLPSRSDCAGSDIPIRVTPPETPVAADYGSHPASQTTAATGSADPVFLAGFWQRATALFLDLLLIAGLPIWALDAFGSQDLFTFEGLLEISSRIWLVSGIVFLLGFCIYSTLLEGSPLRATLGKRALGLIVVRESGEAMPFTTAALRAVAKVGSAAMLLIGFFLAAFSPRKQAFHDFISGTAVVYPIPSALRFH